jgi:putative endonuclease
MVRTRDGWLYVGETGDLSRRVDKHNDGSASSFTASRRPVTLVYWEQQPDRVAALKREAQRKRWRRAKKEALIAGNLELLRLL